MNNKIINALLVAVMVVATAACNSGSSTTTISSFKLTKDAAGTQETATIKPGETFYAKAITSDSSSKIAVKMYLVVDGDTPNEMTKAMNLKKGDVVPGSELKVELATGGTASYDLAFKPGMAGKYIVVADLLNESGEKKDTKSINFTSEPDAEPAAAPAAAQEGSSATDEKK